MLRIEKKCHTRKNSYQMLLNTYEIKLMDNAPLATYEDAVKISEGFSVVRVGMFLETKEDYEARGNDYDNTLPSWGQEEHEY